MGLVSQASGAREAIRLYRERRLGGRLFNNVPMETLRLKVENNDIGEDGARHKVEQL
jgi:hypothetical protein